jgi:hypothetical protein
MAETDNRQATRHEVVLATDLRLAGEVGQHRIKVRNLSPRGVMAEGSLDAVSGTRVEIAIPRIGWIPGAVAWVQGDRFGIAFLDPVDPALVELACGNDATRR